MQFCPANLCLRLSIGHLPDLARVGLIKLPPYSTQLWRMVLYQTPEYRVSPIPTICPLRYSNVIIGIPLYENGTVVADRYISSYNCQRDKLAGSFGNRDSVAK